MKDTPARISYIYQNEKQSDGESITMKKINFDLSGKTALVTGASRGIGEAIALTLSDYGAEVILVSRKIEGLKIVEEKIQGRGGKVSSIAANVGSQGDIQSLFAQVKKDHGKLTILVNNAATNPYFGELMNADEGAWDKTFDVNLKGPFFMMQEGIKLMPETGGSIINVSSVVGISPGPFQGIYSITKAGLIHMTKAFAKELAPKNIRVNALLPGFTETKFSEALMNNDDIYKFAISSIPMNRHAVPEEMAGAVLYLASDASSFTTGTYIACDGGQLA